MKFVNNRVFERKVYINKRCYFIRSGDGAHQGDIHLNRHTNWLTAPTIKYG